MSAGPRLNPSFALTGLLLLLYYYYVVRQKENREETNVAHACFCERGAKV